MSDKNNFKTVGDAVKYCKKHGLSISPVNDQLFDIANSLFNSFSYGLSVGTQAFRQESVYIDARADHHIIKEGLITASKQAGQHTTILVKEYLSKSLATSED